MTTSSSSASLKYVLSDLQGSTRAMMNNNGGSSAIVSRHDYLPFGEEIWSGTGMRSSSQGYGTTDRNRQKYGLTERDEATGLDHTWWRKYESFSGRWTSPDPHRGSMAVSDPQSFNRYAYTHSDPVNFVDPTGLDERWCFGYWVLINGENTGIFLRVFCWVAKDPNPSGSGGGGGGGGGVSRSHHARTRPYTQDEIQGAINTCSQDLFGIKLTGFDPSAKGHNGSFTGETVDGQQINGNSQVHIVNATTSYTIAQMTASQGAPPGYSVVGYEDPSNPHRNFTAKDREKRPSHMAGVSAFVDTQIHELGNSLSDITGIHFSSSPRKRDEDEGQAFQDCVRSELRRSRTPR